MNMNYPLKVFLVCSGLGNIRRGYESFTQECFDALSQDDSLNLVLFKGSGRSGPNVSSLWNLSRNAWITKFLASLFSSRIYPVEPYFIEQASFCVSLIPYIYQQKPDVIFFSDFALGTMLWHWRRINKLSYKLLFSNGAPNGPPFSRMDHVQHLTPIHYQMALDAGEPSSKHSLLPYGVQISQEYKPLTPIERDALRQKLKLPLVRSLVLSVAAINKSHKRIDYLIQEVASLPEPRPYLLLLGQIEKESGEILELATDLLGVDNFQVKTVSPTAIVDYYRVSDVFTLTSLNEGFGRVLLEAMGHGLPCLVHDYPASRYVLKENGFFADFTTPGALARMIQSVLAQDDATAKYDRHQAVYNRFSWEKLRAAYIEMIHGCIPIELRN